MVIKEIKMKTKKREDKNGVNNIKINTSIIFRAIGKDRDGMQMTKVSKLKHELYWLVNPK